MKNPFNICCFVLGIFLFTLTIMSLIISSVISYHYLSFDCQEAIIPLQYWVGIDAMVSLLYILLAGSITTLFYFTGKQLCYTALIVSTIVYLLFKIVWSTLGIVILTEGYSCKSKGEVLWYYILVTTIIQWVNIIFTIGIINWRCCSKESNEKRYHLIISNVDQIS